jgi:hypothetical protein
MKGFKKNNFIKTSAMIFFGSIIAYVGNNLIDTNETIIKLIGWFLFIIGCIILLIGFFNVK